MKITIEFDTSDDLAVDQLLALLRGPAPETEKPKRAKKAPEPVAGNPDAAPAPDAPAAVAATTPPAAVAATTPPATDADPELTALLSGKPPNAEKAKQIAEKIRAGAVFAADKGSLGNAILALASAVGRAQAVAVLDTYRPEGHEGLVKVAAVKSEQYPQLAKDIVATFKGAQS